MYSIKDYISSRVTKIKKISELKQKSFWSWNGVFSVN